jgi:hypothetical protein
MDVWKYLKKWGKEISKGGDPLRGPCRAGLSRFFLDFPMAFFIPA